MIHGPTCLSRLLRDQIFYLCPWQGGIISIGSLSSRLKRKGVINLTIPISTLPTGFNAFEGESAGERESEWLTEEVSGSQLLRIKRTLWIEIFNLLLDRFVASLPRYGSAALKEEGTYPWPPELVWMHVFVTGRQIEQVLELLASQAAPGTSW